MKTSAPALLPILRSDAVGELLARIYLAPRRRWTLGELAKNSGISLPTATREITRMVNAGLLREARVGKTRQVHANQEAVLYEPLRQLLTLTYGPVPILQEELVTVDAISAAFIYGSWAARHNGVEGPEPHDVDVLVVGDADPDELYEAGERARKRLRRDVSIRSVRAESWDDADPTDPFLRHVRSSPVVPLDLTPSPPPGPDGSKRAQGAEVEA